MRKIISNTLAILFFVFYLSSSVAAITPIPTSYFSMPAPGFTCGDATSRDPNTTKCCKMPINSPELITAQFTSNLPSILKGPLANAVVDQLNKKAAILDFTRTQVTNEPCINGSPSTPGDVNNDNCICIVAPTSTSLNSLKPICDSMSSNTNEKAQCSACVGNGGYWSALGCFSGNLSEFITQKILGTGVGMAGGISMLCIMFAAFQMQTSSGNAEKIKKAQELLTNCITGLMIIIFSVLILKIIGVDILRLPNFSM